MASNVFLTLRNMRARDNNEGTTRPIVHRMALLLPLDAPQGPRQLPLVSGGGAYAVIIHVKVYVCATLNQLPAEKRPTAAVAAIWRYV